MQGWKNADFSYNDLIWARCGQNSSDISLQEVGLHCTCEDISVHLSTVQVYSCIYNLTYSLDEIKLMLGQGAAQFQGLFKSQK